MMHTHCARVPSVVTCDDEVEAPLLGVSSTLSGVSSRVCRGFLARVYTRTLHGSPRPLLSGPVVSRHFHLTCSFYLTHFRRMDHVSGAQHFLRQRLVGRHHLDARILIYDHHNSRRKLSFGRTAPLEIWHSSHVFTTRFSLL
jgi:hypothetical protein